MSNAGNWDYWRSGSRKIRHLGIFGAELQGEKPDRGQNCPDADGARERVLPETAEIFAGGGI